MFKVIISGRVTNQPEIRYIGDDKVCHFTIAATNDFQKKQDVSYLQCSVWNKRADLIEKYVKKGKQLFILGSGTIKKYRDREDHERSVLNIHCDVFEFGLDSRKEALNIDDDLTVAEVDF